jgi:hypothetical protein
MEIQEVVANTIKNKYAPGPNISIGYFGSQVRFADTMIDLIHPEATRYIDLTVGGCGTPYRVAQTKNLPVTLNDYSYYSYLAATAIFTDTKTTKIPKDVPHFLERILDVKPTAGYLTKLGQKDLTHSTKGFWSKEQRMWIDGFCSTNANIPIALAALGKAILSVYSFRGLTWPRKTSEGFVISDLPLEKLAGTIIRKLLDFLEYRRRLLPLLEHETFCRAATHFVKDYQNFKNSHVYMDPAWPWGGPEPQEGNPYFLSSVLIPNILMQKEIPPPNMWKPSEEARILDDIKTWVTYPLTKGALRVVVNTQSTNYPEPLKVYEFLLQHFGVVKFERRIIKTALAKSRKFEEFFCIIENV